MATNEDLAIAFLCLAGKSEKDEVLRIIRERSKQWDDEYNNLPRLLEAIELPVSQISKKINYLHSSLIQCPFKKTVYEEMANAVAYLSNSARSPIFKPRTERTIGGGYVDTSKDHVLYLNLNPQSGSQEGKVATE